MGRRGDCWADEDGKLRRGALTRVVSEGDGKRWLAWGYNYASKGEYNL